MAVDLHIEISGRAKNSDFVKDIFQKCRIAKIVIEVVVMSTKTTPHTTPKPSQEASEAPKTGLHHPGAPEKSDSTHTVALKFI